MIQGGVKALQKNKKGEIGIKVESKKARINDIR